MTGVKVEIGELEHLLGPEDSEVEIRHVVVNARSKKRRRFFQIFSALKVKVSSWWSVRARCGDGKKLEAELRRQEEKESVQG